MDKTKSQFIGKYILWLVLAIPGLLATVSYMNGQTDYGMIMHITGEFAGRFLAISLMVTPIALMFPKSGVGNWLIRNRRFFGLAAFAYTFLHTIFYVLEFPFSQLINEGSEFSILTGWIAFFIFIP